MVPPLPSLRGPHWPLYTGSGVGDAEAELVLEDVGLPGARDLDLVVVGDTVMTPGPMMQ